MTLSAANERVDAVIDEMFARPAEQGVSLGLVAKRGGEVVAERYGVQPANDLAPELAIDASSTLLSWSMAKSMVHAALGILVSDGLLDVDQPAAVPEWAGTDRESITVLQLLEMRSGLHFIEDYVDGDTSNCIEMLFGGTEPSFAHYAATQPLAHAPGTVFNYSSGTSNILARLIGDTLTSSDAPPSQRQARMEQFLRDRLFAPAGMHSAMAKFDDAGDFVGSSYVYATAHDFARFGELYLHDGVTECGSGDRILPVGWTRHASAAISHDADSGLGYGRHFWLWPAFPGSFASHGYEGQFIVVFPDRDLVLVHLGKTDVAHSRGLQMRLARLAELLV